jgi:hypothetical protein
MEAIVVTALVSKSGMVRKARQPANRLTIDVTELVS